jgi:hypothetical protein
MTVREIADLVQWVERIAVLETQVSNLATTQAKQHEAITEKLDELLALRHKGVGAFWVASSLLGTGILGALYSFFNWIK